MFRAGLRVDWGRDTFVAGLAVIAIIGVAYKAASLGLYRPSITQTGKISVDDAGWNGITAATRQVVIGKHYFWQVEVSPGDWRDCGRDCAKTLREAQ